MEDVLLFKDEDGNWTSLSQLVDALFSIGAADCDVLVVQTGILFGIPNRNLKRRAFVEYLFEALRSLKVDTMIIPTFSFSFCNHEDYDVIKTKSCLGMLADYALGVDGVRRTHDPLLSMAVIGKEINLLGEALAENSLGPGSAFDIIHHLTRNVKFLCYGSEFSEYFTYIHYVEKMLEVPYRFDIGFDGTIIDEKGVSKKRTQYIHTACGGVEPAAFPQLKQSLINDKAMEVKRTGSTDLVCVAEPDVFRMIEHKLRDNIYYFLAHPYTEKDLTHIYKYGKDGNRITHC